MVCCIGWFAIARIRENLAPVPGWTKFGNTGETDPVFELWLPKYYEGIDPVVVTWMITNAEDQFGNQYSSWFDAVKIVFSARDTRTDDAQPDVLVSYSVSATDSETTELLLEKIRSRVDQQPNIRLIDSEIISLNNYKAIFLVYDTNFEGLELRQIQYVILDGSITWSVLYIPNKDKYEEELSIFERSIQTFKVHQ